MEASVREMDGVQGRVEERGAVPTKRGSGKQPLRLYREHKSSRGRGVATSLNPSTLRKVKPPSRKVKHKSKIATVKAIIVVFLFPQDFLS